MEDVWEVLVSSRRSNRAATREKASPSGPRRRGPGNRSILWLLGVLTLTSCFDQILLPDVDTDGRLTVTNGEEALRERLSYVEVEIPIDPVSPASPALFEGAAAAPTRSTVSLTLVAELDPPTVDGEVVQATAISPPRRFTFLISYNTRATRLWGRSTT